MKAAAGVKDAPESALPMQAARHAAEALGSREPWRIVGAGILALVVAMGIGRFAFTPLLPMMLHDGSITLAQGSWLATANYLGYLAGAIAIMLLPWLAPRWAERFPPAAQARIGVLATAIFTAATALPLPGIWWVVRFAAGLTGAVTLLGVASWCMVRLASLGRTELAGLIFIGPGLGIALTGLLVSGMVALGWHASTGWWIFAAMALVMSVFVWPVVAGHADLHARPGGAAVHSAAQTAAAAPAAARAMHALAYGFAGLGYIVTATFLPVIARTLLPGQSIWADLFWPIAGLAAVVGTILGTRTPPNLDRRWLLVFAYLLQACGVALGLFMPTIFGFALSSALVGLPFTAITFYSLQEARRQWPASADSFASLISVLYGIGQIAGPPMVAWLLAHSSSDKGFARGLELAALALVVGAALHVISACVWPRKR